jgi:hypothetical protein
MATIIANRTIKAITIPLIAPAPTLLDELSLALLEAKK